MPTKKLKKKTRGGVNYQSYFNPVVNTLNPFLSLDNFLYVCEKNVCRKLSYEETKNVMDNVETSGGLLDENTDTLGIPIVHQLNNNNVYFCSLKDKKISEYFYFNDSNISFKKGGDVSQKRTIYPSELTLYPDEPVEEVCSFKSKNCQQRGYRTLPVKRIKQNK